MVARAEYRSNGASAVMFELLGLPVEARPDEILIEGPAGTGKTRGLCEWTHAMCLMNPGIRVLWARYTLTSLRQSVQVTFEQKVLGPNSRLTQGASREHRTSYKYANGSEIVLGGLQPTEITRTFSTEYDIIVVFEAIEITRDTWEKLARANRNAAMPWQVRVADTNPGSEYHWLNQSFPAGVRDIAGAQSGPMLRLLSRHEDNPAVTEAYLRKLRRLQGANRARMYEGRWVSAEGQVWPRFDPPIHMVDLIADAPDEHPRDRNGKLQFVAHAISIDWGFRHPGVMQVWGLDEAMRAYRIAEIYRTGQTREWWADRFDEFVAEFGVRRGFADGEERTTIESFNDRLAQRGLPRFLRAADKSRMVGLDMVNSALDAQADGRPRMFFVRHANRYVDHELQEKGLPTRTEEEIPSYVWRKAEDGRQVKEETDPLCADHGCDATRYLAMGIWRENWVPRPQVEEYAPGTLGDLLGHNEPWAPGRKKGEKKLWGARV